MTFEKCVPIKLTVSYAMIDHRSMAGSRVERSLQWGPSNGRATGCGRIGSETEHPR